jgi:hypothetical protein
MLDSTTSRAQFNLTYTVDKVLQYFGFEPDNPYGLALNLDLLFNEYVCNIEDSTNKRIQVLRDATNNVIEVIGLRGAAYRVKDAFDCYIKLGCDGNEELAIEWGTQSMHIDYLKKKRKQTSNERIAELKNTILQLQRSRANTDNQNNILEHTPYRVSINLDRFLNENTPFKQWVSEISALSNIPINTTFLIGLGVISGITSKKYAVYNSNYQSLPIGLFILTEQCSVSLKSGVLSYFQAPIFKYISDIERRIKYDASIDKEAYQQRLNCLNNHFVPITTITLPALRKKMKSLNSFCSLVSSEQSLINTLCHNENDFFSSMFEGTFTRVVDDRGEVYRGYPAGNIVCFAPKGGIEKIFAASKHSELITNFLMITENPRVGKRVYKQREEKKALLDQYAARCQILLEQASRYELNTENLIKLKVCDEGWELIFDHRNLIEHYLADVFTYDAIMVTLFDKVEAQILKLATNLYLLDADLEELFDESEIPLIYVESAIHISNEALRLFFITCEEKGLLGLKLQYESILSMFMNKGSNYKRTERQIIQSRSKVNPFNRLLGNKSDYIRAQLKEMVNHDLLIFTEPDEYSMK